MYIDDKKIHTYKGEQFGLIMNSRGSAILNIMCGEHEHAYFGIRTTADPTCLDESVDKGGKGNWLVGRKRQEYLVSGTFDEAVDRAAGLLLDECLAMLDITDFFKEEGAVRSAHRVLSYEEREFLTTRDSDVSAKVEIRCEEHEHEQYILGLVDDEALGWVTGRPGIEDPKYVREGGSFAEAIEKTADLLISECGSMKRTDGFFKEG